MTTKLVFALFAALLILALVAGYAEGGKPFLSPLPCDDCNPHSPLPTPHGQHLQVPPFGCMARPFLYGLWQRGIALGACRRPGR